MVTLGGIETEGAVYGNAPLPISFSANLRLL